MPPLRTPNVRSCSQREAMHMLCCIGSLGLANGRMPTGAMRHAPLRMQKDGSGGLGVTGPGPVAAKYAGAGMGTRPTPDDSMRPDEIDYEAAAASQPSKDAKPVPDVIAGGFSSRTLALVDTLRVGDGRLAGDVGFEVRRVECHDG